VISAAIEPMKALRAVKKPGIVLQKEPVSLAMPVACGGVSLVR
jgi:hypothetical protein